MLHVLPGGLCHTDPLPQGKISQLLGIVAAIGRGSRLGTGDYTHCLAPPSFTVQQVLRWTSFLFDSRNEEYSWLLWENPLRVPVTKMG